MRAQHCLSPVNCRAHAHPHACACCHAETPAPGDAAALQAAAAAAAAEEDEEATGLWWSNPVGDKHALVAQHDGIGKFLPALRPAAAAFRDDGAAPAPKKHKPAPTGGFGDFAGW